MLVDLLSRKQTHFILWRPGISQPPPSVYIAKPLAKASDRFEKVGEFPLSQSPDFPFRFSDLLF